MRKNGIQLKWQQPKIKRRPSTKHVPLCALAIHSSSSSASKQFALFVHFLLYLAKYYYGVHTCGFEMQEEQNRRRQREETFFFLRITQSARLYSWFYMFNKIGPFSFIHSIILCLPFLLSDARSMISKHTHTSAHTNTCDICVLSACVFASNKYCDKTMKTWMHLCVFVGACGFFFSAAVFFSCFLLLQSRKSSNTRIIQLNISTFICLKWWKSIVISFILSYEKKGRRMYHTQTQTQTQKHSYARCHYAHIPTTLHPFIYLFCANWTTKKSTKWEREAEKKCGSERRKARTADMQQHWRRATSIETLSH